MKNVKHFEKLIFFNRNLYYIWIVYAKTTKLILNIVDNCFSVFEKFDLRYKKDLMNIFIESDYSNGDDTIEDLKQVCKNNGGKIE